MPEPSDLHAGEVTGQVYIAVGSTVLYSYAAGDSGMRSLAAVTLPGMGFTGRRVAQVLGISEEYVSMLRARARREGSGGLARRRGRPPTVSAGDVAKARAWRAGGLSDTAIGARLGVHATTVARTLAGVPRPNAVAGQATLGDPGAPEPPETGPAATEAEAAPARATESEPEPAESEPAEGGPVAGFVGSARVGTGTFPSRYAGAMLLLGYLHRVGAQALFGTLTGGPARRYGDLAVLTTVTLGFALGVDTVEGTKHLRRADAGAAVGLSAIPQMATLRARLSALADGSDPLALQRGFAAGMLATDPATDPVYFVDDHFVAYSGARPVAKGWNTRRRHAEPGIDDTLLTDARGRAVVFASGEPTGLVSTLPGVLTQLREVLGPDAPVLLGFDRGGAYPKAFRACRDAGADWVTYRRAPLAAVTATPRRSWTVRDGKRVYLMLADETVAIKGYGDARQLSLYEHGKLVLQVLTSDLTATGASLLCWLRSRWRIENVFKYAAAHNGIDTLADYVMNIGPDTRKVPNPARIAARKTVAAAEAELIAAQRSMPQLFAGPGTPKTMNAALPGIHKRIDTATAALAEAKTALAPIPAKVRATDLDPDALRARPRIERRGLQMVLRLLAFNAEAWLAQHLDAYLGDPNEFRATTRNLLHLGGHVAYTPTAITVTLHRPDSPRIARALHLLTDELNNTPARIPGDPRPLTYQVTGP